MREDHETIARCLKMYQEWVPRYEPKVFFTDQDSAELLAVSIAFPEVLHFLCEFHIKQSWLLHLRCMTGLNHDLTC